MCRPHRITSGMFTKSNLTQVEHNTKHAQFTNVNHLNIIRKSLWYHSYKKWQIKLGKAGTIDRFGLVF